MPKPIKGDFSMTIDKSLFRLKKIMICIPSIKMANIVYLTVNPKEKN